MRGVLLAVCFVLSACGGGGGPEPAPAQVQAPVAAAPATPAAPAAPAAIPEVQAAPVTPATPEVPAQAPQEPTPPPLVEPVPPPAPPANIACWGDSLTSHVVPRLAALYPERTVFNGGVSGQPSPAIAARQLADTAMTAWVTTFWYGRNNFLWPDGVLRDVASSVAHLAPGNDRFLVLSVLNGTEADERRGSARYAAIMTINNALAARYAGNYFDVRAFLISQADPNNPQDVIDQQNDVVPSSLRVDSIHLTARGYELVAAEIKRILDSKGW